jgi:hypothetical protein
MREEDFGPVLTAAAVLVGIGTVAYALGEDWNALTRCTSPSPR